MDIEQADTTGAADTGTVDPGTQSSDPGSTTATDSGTIQGTPGENGTTSAPLTSDTSVSTPPVQPQAVPAVQPPATSVPPEPNWQEKAQASEKRMNDALAHASRLYQERQQLQAKYQPFANQDPQKVRQALDAMGKAQALKPWNPRHPEYQRVSPRLNKAEAYLATMRTLPQEQQQAFAQQAMAANGLSNEDVKLAVEKERHVQEETQRFMSDPAGFSQEYARQVVREELAQFEQYSQAKTSASQVLGDPRNQAIMQQFAPTMQQIMDPNISAGDKAFFVGNMMAENAALKAQLQNKVQNSAQAEAQQAARRGTRGNQQRSTMPNGQRIEDPYQYVEQTLKLKPGTDDFARALLRVNTGQ